MRKARFQRTKPARAKKRRAAEEENSVRTNTTVWGMGNPLLHDDAVGQEVIKILQSEYGFPTEDISVRDVETSPANFISALKRERPKKFLLVDASDMGLEGGRMRRFPVSRLEGAAFTSHDFPIDMLLAEALPDDCDAQVIAVQPVDCSLCTDGLTPPVAEAARECARLIAEGRTDEIPQLD